MLSLCSLLLSGDVGDVVPSLKSFLPQSMIGRCFETMSSRSTMIGDGTKGGEEPLGMSSRCKAKHRPFSWSCWLVNMLCSIIQTVVLRMFYTGPDLLLCRRIAGQHATSLQMHHRHCKSGRWGCAVHAHRAKSVAFRREQREEPEKSLVQKEQGALPVLLARLVPWMGKQVLVCSLVYALSSLAERPSSLSPRTRAG
jgi:hypothetical protein